MVREFSEEKRQEIFWLLDEIDMRDWKSFMEWCGSRKEEFGDWPDKLSLSAYTRYVDQYHEKVLEINEMTRQQVNTVFENVAEIDARYAALMREHREKVKEQIAIVKTMTEFMDSMANGNPNMALLSRGSVNERCARTEDDGKEDENTEPAVVKWEDIIEPNDVRGSWVLAECLREHGVTDQEEIDRVLEWVKQNDLDLLVSFNLADINGFCQGQNKEEIYNTIMGNYFADTAIREDLDGKVTEFNCCGVRESFYLLDYGSEECLEYITDLYQGGYVSEENYRSLCYWNGLVDHVPSAEADKIRKMMRECFEYVITTVYIYDCLQVLAQREITPGECCKVNEIFRYFGIIDRNNIACLLICCAGESMGFTCTQEIYQPNDKYTEAERGAGYLQVTFKEIQLACLRYIYGVYGLKDDIDTSQAGYSDKIAEDYPWEASAWYWAFLPKVGKEDPQPLNSYVMVRLGDNGGELTLGIVLTAECFVHGDISTSNNDGEHTMDDALHVIARYDSLRINEEGNNGGWYIDGSGENFVLHIPVEMLGIKNNENGISDLDIQGESNLSDYLEFDAPYNWDTFHNNYEALKEAGLIDFDFHTELP